MARKGLSLPLLETKMANEDAPDTGMFGSSLNKGKKQIYIKM